MDEMLEVKFFKDGISDFINLLKSNDIPYEEVSHFPPGTVLAAGETLEIIKALAGLSLAPSIAAVVVQWLKNKASRKVILQTKDKLIVHLEGYSEKEIEALIPNAENIAIIQTKPD
ncbi:MAG: hypothetical protein COB22_06395 [Cycloclasticus sp.]|nr:MAG: hypothetical protein COB22_06395 [Cycloclasticus sp.]